ncbi:MAG: hypothetical protein KME49_15175 [Brasilonema octagenarum HA4186-MV1]|nr:MULTISPECIES: hypothetical protein [Brasilonema]MBW4626797.1 hypothetical protein [Brasilonema octagenarum HA4186-MV1]
MGKTHQLSIHDSYNEKCLIIAGTELSWSHLKTLENFIIKQHQVVISNYH